jgi:hypothetical protein
MNNSDDPITPPQNADTVSRLLVGSRVVIDAGCGHTTLLNSGPCTTGYRDRYLIDRTLGAPGATCRPESFPSPARSSRAAAVPIVLCDHQSKRGTSARHKQQRTRMRHHR